MAFISVIFFLFPSLTKLSLSWPMFFPAFALPILSPFLLGEEREWAAVWGSAAGQSAHHSRQWHRRIYWGALLQTCSISKDYPQIWSLKSGTARIQGITLDFFYSFPVAIPVLPMHSCSFWPSITSFSFVHHSSVQTMPKKN